MKRQFLGDARDAFKWEYHDFLVRTLGLPTLQIVPMMNDDDLSGEGTSHPTQFPADPVFHDFCMRLRKTRSLKDLPLLPRLTGANYRVVLHKPRTTFTDLTRDSYFSNIRAEHDQLLFVDPCTGFEPSRRLVKHIAFADAEKILSQISNQSVVTVYQHWQHKPFEQTLQQIQDRLSSYHISHIVAHPVMIIGISKSSEVNEAVIDANLRYAAQRGLHR